MKRVKFTEDDLNEMILNALKKEPVQGKPNALEKLKSAAGLNRIRNERTQPR